MKQMFLTDRKRKRNLLKFYLKSLNPDEFLHINQAVTLAGIYTEPADFSYHELDVENTLKSVMEMMSEEQTIFVYGIGGSFRMMLEEGKRLAGISRQIQLVVPANEQGFMAMKASHRADVQTALGALYQSDQAAIALQDGAQKMIMDLEKVGRHADAMEVLSDILDLMKEEDRENLIVVCPTLESVRQAMRIGARSICAGTQVYNQMLFNVLTDLQVMQAREEWMITYTRNQVLD